MEPMEPMKPMDFGPKWWPDNLGKSSSSGSQDGVQYAFFPDSHRLAIKRDGNVTQYDSGNHQITGVSQQQGGSRPLTFSSQNGDVKIDDLKELGS
jgi:hypothetical protein